MSITVVLTLWVICLPLVGLSGNLLYYRRIPRRVAGAVATVPIWLAAALSWGVAYLYTEPAGHRLWTWMQTDLFTAGIGLHVDWLTVLMLITVTTVSACVHLYSFEYMREDEGFYRFFLYLNLFVFAMLVLVCADNLLVLLIGWEGVGVCSYLLIGFWYDRSSARWAGQKAFVVNRIGDVAFLLGLLLTVNTFGTVNIAAIQARLAGAGEGTLLIIALLLFGGAVGKSAQFPLHVWLPDAMEGPTPVSSLIHAATMVTAGVYLVARLDFLYQAVPVAGYVVALTGALTALFAASIALVHRDMKRILAFSTVSQLGFMFVAAGVGAYGAALFHLMTHAFFKGLLFLMAGSVMHALHGELDIFRMGRLAEPLPYTAGMAVIGGLGLAGVPPLAGFWSKDHVLAAAGAGGTWVDYLLLGCLALAALLTALYTFRMVFVAFWGSRAPDRPDDEAIHECGLPMGIGMMVLAGGTLFGGGLGSWAERLAHVSGHGGPSHGTVMALSLVAAFGGILLAYGFYQWRPTWSGRVQEGSLPVHRTLSEGYYVEPLYARLVVDPLRRGARFLWRVVDDVLIDGAVSLSAVTVDLAGLVLRFTQTGYLRHYLLMLAGTLVVLFWCLGLYLL